MARENRLSNRAVAICLALFFILGLGLRIGLNVDASFDDEGGRYVYSGNDPYYHDRVVREITTTGQSVVFDEAINYPMGAFNPNPPVYDWTTAFVAGIYEMVGVEDAPGAALNSMVALWGALTVFPVFVIATALWNRTAGLWAGFLMAVSAPHIQRGVWGFADHDATTMFFITLAMAFLVKGLQTLDQREYVKDWRHSNALVHGLYGAFTHNKAAMLWSALAGVALSATALTWKGYPYVLAVMAVAVGLQLLWDHVKNKDSTAVWAFYMLPMIMVTLIPLPYYMVFSGFLDTTIWAGLYVLFGVIIVGAILVPTRDLPSILVFPALALTAIIGLLVMLFVVPDVGNTIFTGLGYFQQSKLFTTIAEAQRSELGRVAASFGFFTFLLAFYAFGLGVKKAWKGDNAHMLMAAWAIVAGFMAFAAGRFIMNAAPVFAVLSAGAIAVLVGKVGLDDVRKRFARQHGQGALGAGVRSMTARSTIGVLLIGILLVLPNLWLGVDAAIPRDEEDADDAHLGAFGIDFDIKDNGWGDVFAHLRTLDTDMDLEDRPAFIAWWDYGHWATDLGHHPTVADPFQSHFQVAGRFLASESEEEAIGWLSALILENAKRDGTDISGVLSDHGVNGVLEAGGQIRMYEYLDAELDGDAWFAFYEDLMDATGDRIEYLGVDSRMYPFSINSAGIFYAPSFLANKNPDDFIQYTWRDGSGALSLQAKQYGVDENGDSYRLENPVYETSSGARYDIVGGLAYPAGTAVAGTHSGTGTPVSPSLQATPAFYDSMYAQAFGHGLSDFTPGEGLSHWRVIAAAGGSAELQAVKLLQYYGGVEVSGTITDDAGNPIPGMQVTFVDGYGAAHDFAVSDDDGMYTVLAPFSQDGDLTLEVRSAGNVVASSTEHQFTLAQARARESVQGADFTVARGSISGNVFADADGNTTFDAGEGISGVTVSLGDRNVTAGADGSYTFTGVTPGGATVRVQADGYETATRSVTVRSGETAEADIALTVAASATTLSLNDADGPVATLPFSIVDAAGTTVASPTTNATGMTATPVNLMPGDYRLVVDYQVQQGETSVTYSADEAFTVAFGGDDLRLTFTVSRS